MKTLTFPLALFSWCLHKPHEFLDPLLLHAFKMNVPSCVCVCKHEEDSCYRFLKKTNQESRVHWEKNKCIYITHNNSSTWTRLFIITFTVHSHISLGTITNIITHCWWLMSLPCSLAHSLWTLFQRRIMHYFFGCNDFSEVRKSCWLTQ